MTYIKSVPYKVSLRWLFYRLLQDGIYKSKDDYRNKFKTTLSNARHNNICGFAPDTIEDDTRDIYWHGIGALTEKEAIENIECNLDKLRDQKYIVLLLYEARAMHKQFAYYTQNIPLIPLGGDASIPLKYNTARGSFYSIK